MTAPWKDASGRRRPTPWGGRRVPTRRSSHQGVGSGRGGRAPSRPGGFGADGPRALPGLCRDAHACVLRCRGTRPAFAGVPPRGDEGGKGGRRRNLGLRVAPRLRSLRPEVHPGRALQADGGRARRPRPAPDHLRPPRPRRGAGRGGGHPGDERAAAPRAHPDRALGQLPLLARYGHGVRLRPGQDSGRLPAFGAPTNLRKLGGVRRLHRGARGHGEHTGLLVVLVGRAPAPAPRYGRVAGPRRPGRRRLRRRARRPRPVPRRHRRRLRPTRRPLRLGEQVARDPPRPGRPPLRLRHGGGEGRARDRQGPRRPASPRLPGPEMRGGAWLRTGDPWTGATAPSYSGRPTRSGDPFGTWPTTCSKPRRRPEVAFNGRPGERVARDPRGDP